VGPLSEGGKRAVARALRGVPVAVRDKASQRLLADLGIEAALTADAALLLELPQQAIQPDAPVLLIPRAGYPEITSALLGVAKALVATGQPVAAMPIQAGEDGPCLEDMKAQLPALQLWRPQAPQEALEHVARARYVVSGRLHGLIFAALAGRPFSGLVYDPKVAAFLDESGARAHPLPPNVAALLEEVRRACPPDAHRLARIKARAQEGRAWLERVLA
jgi:polysaccharide pyruvyl transferase WcaK-like protein